MMFRFFNTYEPVAPLYRDLLPVLGSAGHLALAILASQDYRLPQEGRDRGGVRFRRLPTVGPAWLPRTASKLATSISYATGSAFQTLLDQRDWLNVFLTQPPLLNCWGPALRLLRNQRYCCVIMDLYPWVAIQGGILPESGMLTRRLVSAELFALHKADGIVAIGRCMARRLIELGVDASRIEVIPNWADPNCIRPIAADSNPLRRELGLEGRLVVGYSGNLGASHCFDDLLVVAKRLRGRKDIVFLVIGEGLRLSELQRFASRNSLDSIRFSSYRPYGELAYSLSAIDVHFVSLRPAFTGLVVPSKAYGVLAAGRPIVFQGDSHCEVATMIREHDVGRVIGPGSPDDLEETIVALADNKDLRLAIGERARMTAVNHYSSDVMVPRYVRFLERMGSGT